MRDSLRDVVDGILSMEREPTASAAMVELVVRIAIADGTITDAEWDVLLVGVALGDETTVKEAVARCRKAFSRRPADAVRPMDLRMLARVLSHADARTAHAAAEALLDLAARERVVRRDRLGAGTYREAGAPDPVAPEDAIDPDALRTLLRDVFSGD